MEGINNAELLLITLYYLADAYETNEGIHSLDDAAERSYKILSRPQYAAVSTKDTQA